MTQKQELAISREFSTITIEKTDNGYAIYGLPQGKNFRDLSEYTQISARSLKINGYAFATSGMDIGEYQKSIKVSQKIDGGMAKILLED